MPLITVAPTPGGQDNSQQSTVNSQQSIVNSQSTIANQQSVVVQEDKPVVVGAPVVVQRPKVVSVSLKPTIANEATQLPQKEEVVTEEVSSEPIAQEIKQNNFANDDLIRAWRSYAKKIEGELHTYNTMQNFLPKRGDGQSIVVTLINTMQSDALSRHKRTLEQFLSKELNSSIELNFVVEEQPDQPMFLTPTDNFKRMQEINADFKRLKNELGLELL